MVDYPNGLRPWWSTWKPASMRRHTLITSEEQGKPKKKSQWNHPRTKQLIIWQWGNKLFPFAKPKGTQSAVKIPAVCLVHLEEESTKKEEEVESEDPNGIKGITEEFMVHLTMVVKEAQQEEKCCYHCSSLEHFICDCLLVKASRADSHLNHKEGTALKKEAWIPQTMVTTLKVPQEGMPKA